MEDRWAKLEEIIRRVLKEELATHGFKAKTKLSFEGGKWTGVTTEQIEAWKAAYGSCDVEAELKKMAAWIVSNPHLAPKSLYGRFINSWLARQQNASSIRSIPTRSEQVQEAKKICAYCPKPATGSVGGINCCDGHTHDAMDRKPVLKLA